MRSRILSPSAKLHSSARRVTGDWNHGAGPGDVAACRGSYRRLSSNAATRLLLLFGLMVWSSAPLRAAELPSDWRHNQTFNVVTNGLIKLSLLEATPQVIAAAPAPVAATQAAAEPAPAADRPARKARN